MTRVIGFVIVMLLAIAAWPALNWLQRCGMGAFVLAYQWIAFLGPEATGHWANRSVARHFKKKAELEKLGDQLRKRLGY